MDFTEHEYIDFLNHLFLQELVDFESRRAQSSLDALTLIDNGKE